MTRNPQALEWLIIQNTNAYEIGFSQAWDGFRNALWKNRTAENEAALAAFLEHDAIKMMYVYGAKDPERISPDNWKSDFAFMERPHARRVQLDLFYDYRTNVGLYPEWQMFLRTQQPKTIIFWGQNDPFFTHEGGEAYLQDLPQAEMHRLDAGHFAVEDSLEEIAAGIHRFYMEMVAAARGQKAMGARHESEQLWSSLFLYPKSERSDTLGQEGPPCPKLLSNLNNFAAAFCLRLCS
jgi:pimeloyl-ACP methyl ester carboxylesterase